MHCAAMALEKMLKTHITTQKNAFKNSIDSKYHINRFVVGNVYISLFATRVKIFIDDIELESHHKKNTRTSIDNR